ncbi:MAG: DUF1015 domain-containing protein [Gammaproteobacteria bacterium]|nr:DUF1015 domain-containing protein [Gammaproteobacteria bacterium]
MPLIRPFSGLRPAAGKAAEVAAPPYDVMTTTEAREMVEGRPWSFLHVSRPEVDLPEGTDPYATAVYAKAAENFTRMRQEAVLVQDQQPGFYVYRLTMGNHVQTGIVAAASVAAYDENRIRKHELTRPKKEDDRVRQIEALKAQTGPVFLVYPSEPEVDGLLERTAKQSPEVDIVAADGVRHELWTLSDPASIDSLVSAFDTMPAIYVADGHHRSAAASRVAVASPSVPGDTGGEAASDYFLSVIFPDNQVQILDYNRLIRDLNGLSREAFLAAVGERFQVDPENDQVKPGGAGEFGMYLGGQWYRLRLDKNKIPNDAVNSLDISLLSHELIDPVLGIVDQRTDERIDFLGGIRGLKELQRRVDTGEMAVAFSLFPTSVEALMAVADAGQVMPPKSTWFEPKLADGLVSHLL